MIQYLFRVRLYFQIMGRKIKGKKHHGVKDPEKQRQAREAKVQMKINNRPSAEDFQELPKSMKMLMKVREEVKSGTMNQKRHKKVKDPDTEHLLDSTKFRTVVEPKQKGMNKPLKPVPVFKQHPGEHKRAFYKRINETIQSMKERVSFEEKYKVDVQMDASGASKIVAREQDELDLEMEKKKIEKLAKKGIVVKTKEEKRKLKLERSKMRKNKKKVKIAEKNEENFGNLRDDVQFGERVDAPPSIRLSKFTPSNKPGSKNNLLLHQTLNNTVTKAKTKTKKKSMAQQVALEKERKKAVELYRQLKASKG